MESLARSISAVQPIVSVLMGEGVSPRFDRRTKKRRAKETSTKHDDVKVDHKAKKKEKKEARKAEKKIKKRWCRRMGVG